MLKVNELNVTLNKYEILKDVNLAIDKGEFVAIMGESGSGKTTLLNAIGLLVDVKKGEISYEGEVYSRLGTFKKLGFIRKHIGYIFQDFYLAEDKSIYQNLSFCCQSRGKRKREEEIREVLKRLNIEISLDKKVSLLSGGEKQRIAIARVMLRECDLILADEPTGSLDNETAEMIVGYFKEMRDRGKTVVIVTHSEEIARYTDRVVYLGELNSSKKVA